MEIKLARGRAAIKCVRTIMSRMPEAKQSLRQVLQTPSLTLGLEPVPFQQINEKSS